MLFGQKVNNNQNFGKKIMQNIALAKKVHTLIKNHVPPPENIRETEIYKSNLEKR